ncbi:hypothetical protein B5M09_010902 [Aphanomyces astaci]|uniref:Uncharacterized protein n=1 Tax=Aphanomyces astaci TaxID=112090 RepID=A0A425CQR9_APHAT|nr:hypothetical protein B5M09_010902 [Aphanomyces astaci]
MPPKKKANTPFQDVTRMVATDENPVLRIWCAPHQIDLRQAGQPHEAHERQCPKQTNRWTHIGRLLTFLKSYHRGLMEFCVENRPDSAPICEWWLMTFCIALIIDVVNITLAILASRSLHIAQQESHINALVGTLTAMLDALGFRVENVVPSGRQLQHACQAHVQGRHVLCMFT